MNKYAEIEAVARVIRDLNTRKTNLIRSLCDEIAKDFQATFENEANYTDLDYERQTLFMSESLTGAYTNYIIRGGCWNLELSLSADRDFKTTKPRVEEWFKDITKTHLKEIK